MTETPYSLDKVAIRMVKEPPLYSSTPVRSPDDAVRLMAEMLKGYDREVFCIVNFRNDMTPINMNIVSMGTLNASLVHPREILKSSILSNAAHVMAFHNHPSGSLSPSQEDIQITDRLQKLLDLAGIPLLDHIIIGNGDRYYSFRENQTLPVSENRFATAPEQIHFSPVPEMMVAESTVPGKTADSNGKSESRADRVKAITDKLEAGIAALFQSETYKAYLSTMAKFHNYSLNNTLLIAMQRPDATLVAGYQAWQKQHQRHVKKGEKGIQIIAPSPYKAKKEREVLDPATGRPKLDAQGKPVREIVEVEYPAFRVATVFDVSQTEGKELPSLGVDELTGKVDSYGKLLPALTETCPVPIGFEQIESGAKGYYHTTEHRIALQEGMSEAQTVKTLIHEMAHQRLHSHEKEKPREERLSARSKQVDINTCPANYDFTNVQSDHHIKVVYANAEMDKSVSMKESETIENYPENADIDGDVIRDGDVVSYTIAYENPTSAARNILISDNVPACVSVVDGSISDGGVLTDGKIIWSVQAEPYTKGTVSFDAKMSEDAEGSVVKNTAVVTLQPLTEDGSEKAVTLEDTVGSPILPDPSKSVANENGEDITNQIVNNGSVIMYQITFENPADTEKVFSIKDTVPAEVTYLDGSASDGGQYKDGAISWKLTLAAHETKTVTFNVKVNDPEAAYTHVFNQAEVAVDGTKKDTDSPVHTLLEDPARTPVYVLDDPVKAVLNVDGKNIGTDGSGNMIQTVKQAGDTLFYTVSFGNPADDERTFTITDTLPDGVKFISATDGSSYDEARRTVTWTVNVPATTQASVAVRVEILKEAEDTILKNHATVSVDEAQKDTNEVQTPVIPTPKKDAVSEPGGPSINTFPVQIGENLFYTVTWKNPADTAKTAVITDKLPDGVRFVSADQEGVYSEADHTVTWNVITDAHTEGTVTVKVKVLASAAGTELNNQARVGMDEADITTVTDNGGDDDDTTTNFVAAKTVVNAEGTEIDKQVVAVDDLVTYHIPYQNHSKNTRTITITDVLPQDVTYVEASEGGNVQSIVHGQTVIWVLEAAPKTDGEVWVTVKVTKALKGQAFANSAMLEVTDQETGQTKKAVTNQVINYVLDDVVKEVLSENGRKNLEGEKVKGGRTLLYRVTFKNPATTERTFTVTDELPEGVTFVSAENEGTYDEAAKTITWTVNLASGKSQTVSFLVTVEKTADCDFIQNVAKVHVDETDADTGFFKIR